MTKKSNLIQWRRVQILSATFFCISLTMISCKKDTMLGKTALDPSDLLNSAAVDTFQLKTYTIEEDSVPTKNARNALLGAYNDPKFGTVNANFYTQISLGNPGATNFGVDPIVDSVVLSLQYSGYYGEPDAQTFEVYELDTDLKSDADSLYYSFDTRATKQGDLVAPGQGTITPQPNTKAVVGGDTLAAQLRIPLKNQFGIDMIAASGTHFGTQAAFHEFFKGIHVKVSNQNPAPGTGGVFYFNLSAINSKLTIYYKNETTAKSFAFLMNESSVDFTHMDFNRTGKPIDNVINNPIMGQKEFYTQAFTSRAVVEFPSVDDIPKNSVIHKAQLILPITHYTNDLLYPSVQLSVGTRIKANNDTIYALPNVIAEYDDAQKAYVIDVRQHIQEVVSDQIANRGLFLRSAYFNYTVERIIFNGTEGDKKKKPKLVVTYTTY